MSLPALLAIILGASLTAYAVLAGADFGAGILDLRAGAGPESGDPDSRDGSDRGAIAASIGPLWEANHVWLIFSITILFSAFPRAFSAIGDGSARTVHGGAARHRRPERRPRSARQRGGPRGAATAA